MRRRRAWFKRITKVVATMAVGALLGFLIPTMASDLMPQPEPQVAAQVVPESPVARQFINAYVTNSQSTLDAMGVAASTKQQSARFPAEYRSVDLPVHLGSFLGGGYTLHAYASHVVKVDGTQGILSWRVVTGGGQVAVVAAPQAIDATP
jgi:hypothetical protein